MGRSFWGGIRILSAAICGFSLFPISTEAGDGRLLHFLNAIVFESYLAPLPEDQKAYDTIDLPTAEFPWKFSSLCAPSSHRQSIQLPPGVVMPQQPMFLDICTFRVAADQVRKKKRVSRYNGIQPIRYAIRFLSWAQDRYQVVLDGRYEGFEFDRVLVDAPADKTKIIRIRRSDSRILYIALTPVDLEEPSLKGLIPLVVTSRQPAVYPSELRNTGWSGTVRIRAAVTRDGKINGEGFILLECPHYLFGRNSLDSVLNQWIYQPATRDGIPVRYGRNN